MTKGEIRATVLALLRERILGGSDREIDPASPLGEQGLGLDSLALLEFVTAAEHAFGVEFPDSIWTDRGMLSPETFVDLIVEYSERSPRVAPRSRPQVERVGTATDTYAGQMRAAISALGLFSGTGWIAGRIAERAASVIFAREGHLILARELAEGEYQQVPRTAELTLKHSSREDRLALEGLWSPQHRPRMVRQFHRWLDSGFLCLTAWRGNEVVGIDYLSTTGDYDTETGLRIVTLPGTCYAIGLYEKYYGLGIGIALLKYSLYEAALLGMKRQVTFVRKENSAMIAASTQIYGFTKIGEIATTRWFGKPSSTWGVAAGSGKNGTIHL